MKASTIRPGLLVALKSTVDGGVSYKRVDLETDERLARWETTRIIEDPEEHEKATKCRSAALSVIRKVCSPTSFGLLCPVEAEAALDEAIKVARAMVAEHNEKATFTRVAVYVLKGRIASTDEEAVRAITNELSTLINEMNQSVSALDANAIREAANKAREMLPMLSDDQQKTVSDAIDQARKAARTIVKRIEKEGENAAFVLADIQRGALERARIAFLDMSDQGTRSEALPAIQQQRFADLDVNKE